jgi:hypothetical protein
MELPLLSVVADFASCACNAVQNAATAKHHWAALIVIKYLQEHNAQFRFSTLDLLCVIGV